MSVKITNAMSIDVEDYFQVGAFEKCISRDDWDSLPHRVEQNTDHVLSIMDDAGVKATFFTLGWVAERYPQLIQRIVENGHELASHGMAHWRVTDQQPEDFREDVSATKKLLEDVGGQAVRGYRAASFSIGERNLWALDVLAEEGYLYSSSIYPIAHDHYGMPTAPRFAFTPITDNRFLEFPVTTVEVMGKKVPCGGGGDFRLLPYGLSKWAMQRVNERDQQACIFYFHPWEIDPEQPYQKQAPLKSKFRHYTNLHIMESKLRRALKDFNWGRMDEVFLVS